MLNCIDRACLNDLSSRSLRRRLTHWLGSLLFNRRVIRLERPFAADSSCPSLRHKRFDQETYGRSFGNLKHAEIRECNVSGSHMRPSKLIIGSLLLFEDAIWSLSSGTDA